MPLYVCVRAIRHSKFSSHTCMYNFQTIAIRNRMLQLHVRNTSKSNLSFWKKNYVVATDKHSFLYFQVGISLYFTTPLKDLCVDNARGAIWSIVDFYTFLPFSIQQQKVANASKISPSCQNEISSSCLLDFVEWWWWQSHLLALLQIELIYDR